ncbi:GH92 family glycosyl hydrolase [Phyllobacterium pellucidum]|uniref:GH92 family glycosyl hydrolase n=1 Tax=Phyllobacterium pellucidum TaxID=2740464 RepID=UPI001D135EC8|nr:GH92 family glycosyl hydrolase [Phyllobacterium sp. T1018]UGY10143.1 GH92 family glycosyl hydrolase [Phyllobacterium sp. T1018]
MKKTFITALLGCTMLAGCNNGDDKATTGNDQGTFASQIETLNNTNAALTAQVGELKAANQGASDVAVGLSALAVEVSALKDANLKASTEIAGLSSEVGNLQKADKVADAATSALADQLNDQKNTSEKNANSLAELARQISELQAGGKMTTASLADLAKQIGDVKTQQSTSVTTIAALSKQLDDLKTGTAATTTSVKELQGALSSLSQIVKTVKLETMQPHIADLQAELGKIPPTISTLGTMTDRIAAVKALTEKANKQEISAEDVAAIDDHLKDLAKLGDNIASEKTSIADSLAKGDGILKSIRELPANATVNDVAGIDDSISALLSALKSNNKPLQDRVAGYDKGIGDIKMKIGDLTGQNLAEYVNTMRGAQSSGDFTRGNTFPATAVPFGFNMWSPVNQSDSNWFYQFKTGENGSLIDTVRAFAVVHEPSPWIGNRQSLGIIPIDNETVTSLASAAQKFDRKNEIAQAHYYSLIFNNGTRTEITPTDHAAYFRFNVPADKKVVTLLFDTLTASGAFSYDSATGAISGYTNHGSPQMYFYAVFDAPVTKSKTVYGDTSWVQFNTTGNKSVGMRIATSFISVDQAKANLEDEIGGKSFDQIKDLAEAAWLKKLGQIRVKNATADQKTILYSNMYRAFLYPNSAWEKEKGTGKPIYMSPYTSPSTQKDGKIWVNNGFWDTYRTNWPLYSLLIPTQAGQMIDGFVNGYKDGGWVTRWSGPGYNDSMVATSSDIIIADAYMKGVRNFDVDAAYASMLRNATTYSPDSAKGRKGMDKSIFYGYTPKEVYINDPAPGHVAWSLEADLNDFGIGQMAKVLKKDDDYAYFSNRAINYANLFDGTSTGTWANGWFRTKDQAGNWASGPSTPQSWGYGYTEGNAWSYAFLAPQDGQGLANLYGGRDKLKAKLDKFFTTAPGMDGGSYGFAIHEVKEAAKVHELANVGEYQHSNQTVHHSIYMYNFAGSPSSGQNYLRDVMDKLYFSGFDANGNSTGEGYIGDEDNGEQSAWYLLSSMGIYPVSMGRPEYAIGAPYFKEMTVTLESGKKIVVKAPNVSSSNRYVQSMTLNGKDLTRNYLLHSELVDGATLDFVMGPNPSQWGTGTNDLPTSITQDSKVPNPLKSLLPVGNYDVTASTADKKDAIFDRTSGTAWTSKGAGWIEAAKKAPTMIDAVSLYTLSSSTDATKDPTGWILKGSNDGLVWVTLDTREGQGFAWRRQTRPFALKAPAYYAKYRLEFTGTNDVSIAELELLGATDVSAAPTTASTPVPTPPVAPTPPSTSGGSTSSAGGAGGGLADSGKLDGRPLR